jgi:hypothetical protein
LAEQLAHTNLTLGVILISCLLMQNCTQWHPTFACFTAAAAAAALLTP